MWDIIAYAATDVGIPVLGMTEGLSKMIDWEEIEKAEDIDELKEAKLWLFQENIRLQNEWKELNCARERFMDEQMRMCRELYVQNQQAIQEQKRLKEESLFFEKKMAILLDGFRQLDEDRRAFESKRKELEERTSSFQESHSGPMLEESVHLLFRGVNNPLALRKRYKDLVKIFHPDNLFGDEELAQSINREYLRRKNREE